MKFFIRAFLYIIYLFIVPVVVGAVGSLLKLPSSPYLFISIVVLLALAPLYPKLFRYIASKKQHASL